MDQIIKKFDQHIVGQLNETYERYKFNRRQQATDESIDAYVTTLRYIRKSCNFCDCLADTLLRDRLVMGIRDDETRKKLLEISDLTLTRCIDLCRANEATGARMKQMNTKGGGDKVHGVRKKDKTRSRKRTCKFCGQSHEYKKELCPAWGSRCEKCNGRNHFAARCKKSKVNAVHEQDSDESESDRDITSLSVCQVARATGEPKSGMS